MAIDNILKKAVLMGVGIISLTEQKLKELIEELETSGGVTEKEGKDLLKELRSRAEKERKTIEETIKKGIKDYLAKLDIASKADVTNLKKRVHSLEERVKELVKAME